MASRKVLAVTAWPADQVLNSAASWEDHSFHCSVGSEGSEGGVDGGVGPGAAALGDVVEDGEDVVAG